MGWCAKEEQPDEGSSYWYIGAIIYILGSIIVNFGSNLIRYDHGQRAKSVAIQEREYRRKERQRRRQEAKERGDRVSDIDELRPSFDGGEVSLELDRKSTDIPMQDLSSPSKRELTEVPPSAIVLPKWWQRKWWLLGFGVFAVGNVLNWVAFMFAAQSLCAALGSIQFVSNLIFARFINKETITKRAIVATGFIMAGNVIIVLFGSKQTENLQLNELLDKFLETPFLIYVVVTTTFVIVLQALHFLITWHLTKLSQQQGVDYAMFSSVPSSSSRFHIRIAKMSVSLQKVRHALNTPGFLQKFLPFAYAAISAIIGVNSVLLGKASAGLIQNAISGVHGVLWSPWTYIIIMAFFAIITFWIYRMNRALKLYDAIFIIPVLQVIWLLFGVMEGGIFFGEFANMAWPCKLMFGVGILVLLSGLVILSPKTTAPTSEIVEALDSWEEEEEEGTKTSKLEEHDENHNDTACAVEVKVEDLQEDTEGMGLPHSFSGADIALGLSSPSSTSY